MTKRLKRLAAAVVLAALTLGSTITSSAKVPGGPKFGTYRVSADSIHTFSTISFIRGQTARVMISGAGYTDLDLYIYDRDGNMVAYDEDHTDLCLAEWVPSR